MRKTFTALGIASISFCLALLIAPYLVAQKTAAPVLKLGEPMPINLFVELAKAINPAVVNISTKVRPRQMQMNRDPFFDMLEQLYGLHGLPVQPQQPNTPRPHSLGTGFILREDGLIVTNNHVIDGADEVEVQIAEKSEKFYKAKIIGSDERIDIALIKIEGKNFPAVSLGSSSEAQVGEWVAAFGNPFGQGHTMTKGIISAKGRDLAEINRFPMIQTDTPINPGNSGGPLVNSRGQVIGVNSAIDPRAQGIGFAIPIDEVKKLLPQLEKLGRIRKGYLGIQLADLDPQAAMALGLKDLEGAVVARVEKSSPAATAHVRAYDVITEFNGTKVHSSAELRNVIADTAIGSTVPMKVIREGHNKTLSVTVGEFQEHTPAFSGHDVKKGSKPAPFALGFVMQDLTPALRQELQLDDDVQKPVIVDVQPNSPAANAGLMSGDVVLDVNRIEVATAAQANKAFKKGTNTLRIVRMQAVLFVTLEIP